MRPPVDRRRSTFEELVAEAIADFDRDQVIVGYGEDEILTVLAGFQRREGRSLRTDAVATAAWRIWVERSPHATEWRSRP